MEEILNLLKQLDYKDLIANHILTAAIGTITVYNINTKIQKYKIKKDYNKKTTILKPPKLVLNKDEVENNFDIEQLSEQIRDDLKITLLDSLQKRINFLDVVIKELKLKNIETIHARVEEFGKNSKYRESFEVATSRAVANLSTLTEYLLPLVKLRGIAICMKGSSVEEELETSKKAINVLGGKVSNVFEFDLPKTDIKRNVVIVDKINKTPSKYPRKPGMPSKEPIR